MSVKVTDAAIEAAWCAAIGDKEAGKAQIATLNKDDFRLALEAALTAIEAPRAVGVHDAVPQELDGVAEAIKEGPGCWKSCSGCHEHNEGVSLGQWSYVLQCNLGMGCHECGGIGAVWDATDWSDFHLTAIEADSEPVDDADEAYEIGKRDGYSEAVQTIDRMTGGDGEYRYCTDLDPDRHTPDPSAMIQRIADRFEVLNLLDEAHADGRDRPEADTEPVAVLSDAERFTMQDHQRLQREIKAVREALTTANDAIAEYLRYLDGGEMRGSYDGKPERDGLRRASYATRAALRVNGEVK